MKYISIFIIIIFVIFIIVNHIFKSIKENFSNGFPVGFCALNKELGMRMYDGNSYKCVSMDSPEASNVNTNKQFGNVKSTGRLTKKYDASKKYSLNDYNHKYIDRKHINKIKNKNTCFPNNSDWGKICNLRHGNQYGLKNLISCGNNKSKVNCENLFFNGQDYSNDGNFTYATQCMDKSFDFENICNQDIPSNYLSLSRKIGYNNNSAGVQNILRGKYGDCYLKDGTPNLSKARAICSLRNDKKIDRIRPFNDSISYNKFTECRPMESHDFVSECKNILGDKVNGNKDVFADIDGFDCMPGYGRAKCINKKDKISIPNSVVKLKFDSNSDVYPYSFDKTSSKKFDNIE